MKAEPPPAQIRELAPRTWQWPTLHPPTALVLLLAAVSVGFVQGVSVSRFSGEPSGSVVAGYIGLGWGVWLGFPIVQTFSLNAPDPRRHVIRCLMLFWLGYAPFAALCALCVRASRAAAALVWSVAPTVTSLRVELLLEQREVGAIYAGLVALLSAMHLWQQRDQAERRAAELSALVENARLETLSAQLDPHFLYNALNTICSMMYEDASRTVVLVQSLIALLHTTLTNAEPTWSLGEETRHTGLFVQLIESRFQDRISVAWQLMPRIERAEVPRFALQTLVENAVKHNQHRRGSLRISIAAETRKSRLLLSVSDDGDGFRSVGNPLGGLARLAQIIRVLHGSGGSLARLNVADGGARVELTLPLVMRA